VTARRTRATLRRTRATTSPDGAACTENSWIPATRVAARRPRTMRTMIRAKRPTLITSELRESLVYASKVALMLARGCLLSRDL
jgi:hypothetical protein